MPVLRKSMLVELLPLFLLMTTPWIMQHAEKSGSGLCGYPFAAGLINSRHKHMSLFSSSFSVCKLPCNPPALLSSPAHVCGCLSQLHFYFWLNFKIGLLRGAALGHARQRVRSEVEWAFRIKETHFFTFQPKSLKVCHFQGFWKGLGKLELPRSY